MDIFLAVLFIIICVLLIIVVLLQKGRGGGLGAAFGGAGSSAFGTKTGDVFTWVTIVLTALFLVLAVATVLVFKKDKDIVAPPTFSPAPGAISEPVLLTLTARKKANIYYTLDGSTPDSNSTLFTQQVEIQPGTTVKAVAFFGGNYSAVVTGAYPREVASTQTLPATGPEATSGSAPASSTSAPTSEPGGDVPGVLMPATRAATRAAASATSAPAELIPSAAGAAAP